MDGKKEGRIGNNVSAKGRRERAEEETQHLQGGGGGGSGESERCSGSLDEVYDTSEGVGALNSRGLQRK